MTTIKTNVSDEIGTLIEQHLHARKKAERDHEKSRGARAQRTAKAKTTVEALHQCTPEAIGPELLEELHTKDITRLEALVIRIVQDRWRPAAQQVATLVGLPTFRRIPFPPEPLFEALFLLFSQLVENPDREATENVVTIELTKLFARTGVKGGDLFVLFEYYEREFECVRGPWISYNAAPWYYGPDPRGQGSCMEHDPRIVAIRENLKGEKAMRAIATFKKLCADARDEIPRPELKSLGISPTSVDRTRRSSSDRRVHDNGMVFYRREFLIDYVCNRWKPRESGAVWSAPRHEAKSEEGPEPVRVPSRDDPF